LDDSNTMKKPTIGQTLTVIVFGSLHIICLINNVQGSLIDMNNITAEVDAGENIFGIIPERLFEGAFILDLMIFTAVIWVGFEVMSFLALHIGEWMEYMFVPIRGKHLDDLDMIDMTFITINKLTAPPFVYYYLRYAYFSPNVVWNNLSILNTIVSLISLYIVYDFVYTLLHLALHIRGFYSWIHLHHHGQKAPSRGNVDAVNVHPVEFILGEFNHLLALYVVSTYIVEVHFFAALTFISLGGFLASLNHTRYDVVWFGGLYDSKAHDVHHRIPQSNYGQYTMIWDKIFQTYRPYNPEERINQKVQLKFAEYQRRTHVKKET